MTSTVTFACGSFNQARLALAVAAELERAGERASFLAFDQVLHPLDPSSAVFERAGVPYAHLRPRWVSMVKPWPRNRKVRGVPKEEKIEEVLRELQSKVLVVGNDARPITIRLMESARRLGMSTVFVQDGVAALPREVDTEGLPSTPAVQRLRRSGIAPYGLNGCDRVAVMSDMFAETLQRLGVPKDRIVMTGYPLYDRYAKAPDEISEQDLQSLPPEVRKLLDEPFLLYIGQPLNRMAVPDQIEHYSRVARICQQVGVRLLIKGHPRDGAFDEVTERISQANQFDIAFVRDVPSDPLFIRCRAVATACSTMSFEALYHQRPLALLNYLPIAYELHLGDAAVVAHSPAELETTITRLLTDEELRRRLVAHSRSVLDRETHSLDGRATERVASVIQEVAAAPKPETEAPPGGDATFPRSTRQGAMTTRPSAGPPIPQVEDDPELLDLMLEDLRAAPQAFWPTNYWANYEGKFLPYLREHGLRDFRRCRDTGGGGVFRAFGATDLVHRPRLLRTLDRYISLDNPLARTVPPAGAILSRAAALVERHLSGPDDADTINRLCFEFVRAQGRSVGAAPLEQFSVSLFGNPEDVFHIEGSYYTRSALYYYLRYAYCCRSFDFGRLGVFAELGAGSGKQAEAIHKLHPQATMLLFDIAPQVYIAHQYLSAVFPDDVVTYRETRTLESLEGIEPGKIYIFGNWKFPLLRQRPIDLFWNAASFQEMEPAVVQNYLQVVDDTATAMFLMADMKGKERAESPGRHGVLEPTTLEHYKRFVPHFRMVDMSPALLPTAEAAAYSDSFWERTPAPSAGQDPD